MRLEKVVELDRQKLSELEKDFNTKSALFEELAGNIRTAEAELEEKRNKLSDLDRLADPEAAAALEAEIQGLDDRLRVAKSQSEVSFQAAKTVQTQVEALKKKITREEQAIQDLIGEPVDTLPTETAVAPTEPVAADQPEGSSSIQIAPGVSLPTPPVETSPDIPLKETAQQIEARREAEKLATVAQDAERQVLDFLERKAALEEQIELEKQLLAAAKQSRDNFETYVTERQQELRDLIAAGGTKAALGEVQGEIDEVQSLADGASEEIDQRRGYLDSLRERLDDLHEEQLALTQAAETRRLEAEQARKKSIWLESPLHPQNLGRWLQTRGPRILLVIVVAAVLVFLIRISVTRIARTVVRTSRGSRDMGTNRADTLALSFTSAATMVILVGASLLVLQEAGLDVTTVLGGAAILGVALAFGAQNLMRDYFSGFMILLEDQFELGDLITIGGITGTVEKVNMRTTMLRDIEGRVHFIPNGEIKSITNRTYVWGRAVVDLPIAFKENVDEVMAVLLQIGKELREDPEWSDSVTDEPVMLGVDRFTEYGVSIKFMVQTQPNRIFPVRRELLRRVKNRFDELGIQISVPYRQLLNPPGSEPRSEH
jgi:small conductance mechanosensitive channel